MGKVRKCLAEHHDHWASCEVCGVLYCRCRPMPFTVCPKMTERYVPQASDEDREQMRRWFGEIDEQGPIRFLESRGYVLRKDWRWEKPVPSHTLSVEELACIHFLADEWDFGGVYYGD